MNQLVTAIPTGLAAFSATNIDDLVILTLFFSQVNNTFRSRHIYIGQYLGFGVLVIASLTGFFGGLVVPSNWIGLLGLMPIATGLSRLLNKESDSVESETVVAEKSARLHWSRFAIASFISPQTYSVAAVTIANGSDNIGIYMPLFANSTWESLLIILGIFFSLVGVWCYAAYTLTRLPAINQVITPHSNALVPFVLIALGAYIVWESGASILITSVASCLYLTWLILAKNLGESPELEKN
ncbi:MAG: cadmium resistance transporter [Hassallia sp. WJT32-NPBG1]|jgi:cadmium resistance transport/sequestration family protein|nr:cadmium resistance transporter [Hassallia sp. WJT32-NPBG1]